ncbi:MAG: DUF3817 domain-containing protein [Myxococcota bacterium]
MIKESWVRALSLIEGLSYILLVGIAMPLKYVGGIPHAVRVPGMIHGVLFVLLAAGVFALWASRRFSMKTSLFVMLWALVPLGALVLEREWRRRGSFVQVSR